MCGIIGYTWEKEAEDILVDGLEISISSGK